MYMCPAIPENREMNKVKFIFFFCQRHALSTSFDIFVVTYRVTNFLPKLIHMLLFSMEKTEFPFFEFHYFRVLPIYPSVQIFHHKLAYRSFLSRTSESKSVFLHTQSFIFCQFSLDLLLITRRSVCDTKVSPKFFFCF